MKHVFISITYKLIIIIIIIIILIIIRITITTTTTIIIIIIIIIWRTYRVAADIWRDYPCVRAFVMRVCRKCVAVSMISQS